jgi:hypothetical protein
LSDLDKECKEFSKSIKLENLAKKIYEDKPITDILSSGILEDPDISYDILNNKPVFVAGKNPTNRKIFDDFTNNTFKLIPDSLKKHIKQFEIRSARDGKKFGGAASAYVNDKWHTAEEMTLGIDYSLFSKKISMTRFEP